MRLTLNKLFKFTDNDGIFTYLNTYDVPWKNDVDVDILDLDYHTKFGTRIIGKPVQVFLTEDGLSTQNKQKLAKLILYSIEFPYIINDLIFLSTLSFHIYSFVPVSVIVNQAGKLYRNTLCKHLGFVIFLINEFMFERCWKFPRFTF